MPRSKRMTRREVEQALRAAGCTPKPGGGKGSHTRWVCGTCVTTVPGKASEQLPIGTLKAIARQVRDCIGQHDWMPPLPED